MTPAPTELFELCKAWFGEYGPEYHQPVTYLLCALLVYMGSASDAFKAMQYIWTDLQFCNHYSEDLIFSRQLIDYLQN